MKALARRVAATLLLAGTLFAAGCATPNANIGLHDRHGHEAGFLFGLWHGFTAPVSLVGSAVTHRGFTIYEVRNAGTEYEAGFLLGFTAFLVALAHVLPSDERPRDTFERIRKRFRQR